MKNSDYTNSEKPIYPRLDGTPVHPSEFIGLTKREYFAGLAMQGLMTKDYVKLHIDGEDKTKNGYTNVSMIADISIQIADELLKALESK